LIFHQCTPNLKNDVEAADAFSAIRVAQDLIALLKLIQSLCCSYDAKTQSFMATVASHKCLFTYYQQDGDDNHRYYQEFCTHVGTLETYGGIGAIRITPAFMTAKLKELAAAGVISTATAPTDAERMKTIKLVRDEFLGCLMLSGSNRDQYAALKADLKTNMDMEMTHTLSPRTSACRYSTNVRMLQLDPLAPKSLSPLLSNRRSKLLCSRRVPQTRKASPSKRTRGLRLLP
jgi:hypothetical protein